MRPANASGNGDVQRRRVFFDLPLFDFDLREDVFGFAAAASSRRFFAAQPGLFACRPRAIPSASAGTLSVIVDPAAT